jgi:hypothetical protein
MLEQTLLYQVVTYTRLTGVCDLAATATCTLVYTGKKSLSPFIAKLKIVEASLFRLVTLCLNFPCRLC